MRWIRFDLRNHSNFIAWSYDHYLSICARKSTKSSILQNWYSGRELSLQHKLFSKKRWVNFSALKFVWCVRWCPDLHQTCSFGPEVWHKLYFVIIGPLFLNIWKEMEKKLNFVKMRPQKTRDMINLRIFITFKVQDHLEKNWDVA